MQTPKARQKVLGPLATRFLHLVPRIAFVSTIVISILTFPVPLRWMLHVFVYGGSLAHLEDRAPPLVRFIDEHGRGHYVRMADSKWSTLLHVLPGE